MRPLHVLAAQEKLKAFQTHFKMMQASTPASVRACVIVIGFAYAYAFVCICAGRPIASAIPRAVLPAENEAHSTAAAADRGIAVFKLIFQQILKPLSYLISAWFMFRLQEKSALIGQLREVSPVACTE